MIKLGTRTRWILLAGVPLAALAALATLALRAPMVQVLQMQPALLVRTLQFSARVATLSRVDVGSTLTGRVVQVRVR